MKIHENNVYNSEDFNFLVKSYLSNGFVIYSHRNNVLFLNKKNYGNLLIHVFLLITTIWFSFGISNLIYLLLSYYLKSKTVSISLILNTDNKDDNFNFHTEDNDYKFKYKDISDIIEFLDKPINDENKVFSNKSKTSNKSPIIDYLDDIK